MALETVEKSKRPSNIVDGAWVGLHIAMIEGRAGLQVNLVAVPQMRQHSRDVSGEGAVGARMRACIRPV